MDHIHYPVLLRDLSVLLGKDQCLSGEDGSVRPLFFERVVQEGHK